MLIRKIVLECMTWNVRLFGCYIETNKNNFADTLSRFQNDRFGKDAKKYQKTFNNKPDVIPTELWPMEKVWAKGS